MFPVIRSSTSILYILVPSYNPLIEGNARGGGDPGKRISDFRPGRGIAGNRAEIQSKSGREPDHVGAACCGGFGVCITAQTLGAFQAQTADHPNEVGATSEPRGRGWWAHWKAGRRREPCSDRAPDKKGSLETGAVPDSRTGRKGWRQPPDGCERSQPTFFDRGLVF